MSTTHSSFDQYCISHKTISHRAAAAPGPEVRRKCPMTLFPSLPLLATNPGDATVRPIFNLCMKQKDRSATYIDMHIKHDVNTEHIAYILILLI